MKPKHSLAIALAMALLVPQMSRGQAATSRVIPFNNVPTTVVPPALAQTFTMQLWNASTQGTQRYCENQTLDVTPGPDGVTGVITFNFGAGVAPPTPCLSGPPGGLNPVDFVSGESRFLDIVDSTGASVLPAPGRIPLNAAAFALNPGPQGPQGIQGPPGAQGPPGVVQTVSAGDPSITVGGTAAARLVSIAPNGITNAHVSNNTLDPAKITGRAATLGSNNFVGDQNVNGSLFVSNPGAAAVDGIGLVGVRGSAGAGGFAIVGSVPANGIAGQFNGPVNVTGPLSAGGNLRVEGGVSASSAGSFDVDAPFVPGGRLRILPNGNVGIGQTQPQFRLDVAGDTRVGGAIVFGDGTRQTSAPFSSGNSDSSNIVIPNQLPAATILSQNLSAGTFVAFATVHFTNATNPGQQIVARCFFNNEGITFSYRFTLPSPANEGVGGATEATETFHTIITTTGGAISLSCVLDNGTAGRVFAFERRITAVRIAP